MALPGGRTRRPPPAPVLTAHEMECKICYERFDGWMRRPKLLSCGHGVCARCLRRMADAEDSPARLSCPFCRQETPVPERDVARLPDDGQVLALLGGREGASRLAGGPLSPEVLLCPGVLDPLGDSKHSSSSDCLVITLVEVPEDLAAPEGVGVLEVMRLYRPPSLGSLPCSLPLGKCQPCGPCRQLPRVLLAMLCLAYLSSLPLGIYLLLEGHLNLGIVLVSLVPSTLLLCLFYSLCQCLCQEIFNLPS